LLRSRSSSRAAAEATRSPSASPTDEWADGFCTAITTWTDSLTSVREQFTSPSSLSKEALEGAASDIKGSTDELVSDLRALGAPDTESGEEIKSSLDELSNTLESEVANVEGAVDDVSGLTGIPGALTSVSTSLSAMGTAFASTLEAVGNADVDGELQTALEDSPACADITN
jgi:hypothetical protein